MENPSDSSSSDENENLRDALDLSMFNVNVTKSSTHSDTKHSARDYKPVNLNYKSNILNVTPEFQNFVAKRLTEKLDKTIKECHFDFDYNISHSSGGIKLFSESKKLLKDKNFFDPLYSNFEPESSINMKKRKKNNITPIEDDCEFERLRNAKSAAVSPSWVLEKKGVIGWSKPKGDLFNYRKNEKNELELVSHQ